MENAVDILIKPVEKMWGSLNDQFNATRLINELLTNAVISPTYINILLQNQKDTSLNTPELYDYILKSLELQKNAFALNNQNKHAITYPLLVGVWSIIEATFDDLILALLLNDKDVITKLSSAKINVQSNFEVGSNNWADVVFQKIKRKSSEKAKSSVFEYHKICLSLFEITLEYQPDRVNIIEEINQVRNCILHNQGEISYKAGQLCPRLNNMIGQKIMHDDPLFIVSPEMILNYTVAWLWAIYCSPYFSDPLSKVPKNIFSNPELVEAINSQIE
jgi:hypothetical protein